MGNGRRSTGKRHRLANPLKSPHGAGVREVIDIPLADLRRSVDGETRQTITRLQGERMEAAQRSDKPAMEYAEARLRRQLGSRALQQGVSQILGAGVQVLGVAVTTDPLVQDVVLRIQCWRRTTKEEQDTMQDTHQQEIAL